MGKREINVGWEGMARCRNTGTDLFVVGGWNGRALSSVEWYNPDSNQWNYAEPLSSPRSGLDIAFFDEKIYAVGGWDGRGPLSSVERYSLVTNQWQNVTSMSTARDRVAVAVL